MKKKIVILLLALSMGSVALTGCGKDGVRTLDDTVKVETGDTDTGDVNTGDTAVGDGDTDTELTEEVNAENTDTGVISADTVEAGDTGDISADTGNIVNNNKEFSDTWKVIKEYGTSNISVGLDGTELTDFGDYYEEKAYLFGPVTVPSNLGIGETYHLTIVRKDEVLEEDIIRTDTYEFSIAGDDYSCYYSFSQMDDGTEIVLFEDSDDRVETLVYVGRVRIWKGARVGEAIMNDYWTLREEDIVNGYNPNDLKWYNGVSYDMNGYITDLVFYGD